MAKAKKEKEVQDVDPATESVVTESTESIFKEEERQVDQQPGGEPVIMTNAQLNELKAGEFVVKNGGYFLKSGQPIKLV